MHCAPYVVAEVSANHNGSLQRALETISAAKECGVDAVKLQTFTAETMTINCDRPEFIVTSGLWKGRSLFDLYTEAQLPLDWHEPLFTHAQRLGLTIFSTPFDTTAVDLLEQLGTPAYKIASLEITDLELIRIVAHTGKPVILSTGLASLAEIAEAIDTLHQAGCDKSILLHCTSCYPAPVSEANLLFIPQLRDHFGLPVGLSDHTLGTTVPVAAVATGACLIEKHFTLSRNDGGLDCAFSLEPAEMATLCRDVRNAWLALGSSNFGRSPGEEKNRVFRRSIYTVTDVRAGDVFGPENVRAIRPGMGLPPSRLRDVYGRIAPINMPKGTPLTECHLV
jgi:pseudaminic acid synthase